MKSSEEVIQALISGGAHLDYRAKNGKTALHKAVKSGNQSVIEVSIDLMLENFHKIRWNLQSVKPISNIFGVGGNCRVHFLKQKIDLVF